MVRWSTLHLIGDLCASDHTEDELSPATTPKVPPADVAHEEEPMQPVAVEGGLEVTPEASKEESHGASDAAAEDAAPSAGSSSIEAVESCQQPESSVSNSAAKEDPRRQLSSLL